MNSVWVITVNRSVYGVAEDRLTAYLMLKTYVRTLSGVPYALAKNILEASYNSNNLNKISINANTYAEPYHVTEVDEV